MYCINRIGKYVRTYDDSLLISSNSNIPVETEVLLL